MRVLHVVTLIAPDNPFGGPVRVAVNHARALRSEGHEVEVIAGARNYTGPLPTRFDGEPVRLFRTWTIARRLGFSGLLAPSMLRWLASNVRSFDVVHIHLARDLITLPAAILCSVMNRPYVLQTHGMIDASKKRLAGLLDALLTKRALRNASTLLFLTPTEHMDLITLSPELRNLSPISNGVPLPTPRPAERSRTGEKLEVLFLARLHARKRPLLFAEAAQAIARIHPDVAFRLVGPDEGEASALRQLLDSQPELDIIWEGALEPERVTERLSRGDLYVLPSVDEPFPMSVLEAMAAGVPVIVTESCGLAPAIAEAKAGVVCSETLPSLIEAIDGLVSDSAKRTTMGDRAAELILHSFTATSVAKDLEKVYEGAVSGTQSGGS